MGPVQHKEMNNRQSIFFPRPGSSASSQQWDVLFLETSSFF